MHDENSVSLKELCLARLLLALKDIHEGTMIRSDTSSYIVGQALAKHGVTFDE